MKTFAEATEKLAAGEEVVLDFSSMSRVTTASIEALEKLAAAAEQKSARITLRGVNVDVYRALKVARLAPRFSFLT